MNRYPCTFTLNDGTSVEVNLVLDGKAFMFHLTSAEKDAESFVWTPPGVGPAQFNYESELSTNEMEALQAFLKMQRG